MYSGSRLADLNFAYGAFTLSGWLSQNHSAKLVRSFLQSEPRNARIPVWALSISLAATLEITVVFSSSGYLDVSVHRVPSAALFIHAAVTALHDRRVPPFGYPWLFARLQLPMAFRSLPRPSSALGTKASTLRSF